MFVGHVPARVRDLLWERVLELAKDGRAILIHSTKGEQRLAFMVHRHDWQPTDFDGVQLMLRPAQENDAAPALRKGWSNASKYRAGARRKRST